MISNFIVQLSPSIPTRRQDVEVVERKGKGHPDTICDAIAENISVELSQAYQNTFGRILHHNIDKGFLVAGQVRCRMGGGKVIEPMRLVIGDRAAMGVGRKTLPVADIAVETAKSWFKQNLPHIDPNRHVRYQVELKSGSSELGGIFHTKDRGLLGANDTSAAVGYAPFTPTENLVIGVEQFLNGQVFKSQFPETGEDVKVMGIRFHQDLSLIVAMPIFAKAVHSESDYFDKKRAILKGLRKFIHRQPHGMKKVTLTLNALDAKGKGIEGMYLTVLGTSAEQGDSGQVGRGNRVNGLITLNRPMTGEAAAGKNPVSHVGKIYNVLAHQLAKRIHDQIPPVQEVTVWLTSTIGKRIDHPAIASAYVNLEKGTSLRSVRPKVQNIMQDGLSQLNQFCQELAKGQYPVY